MNEQIRSLQSQLASAFGQLDALEIALRRAEAEAKGMRDLLRRAYEQWPGDYLRPDLPPDKLLKVWFSVEELRQIAALFVEEDG